ncbi:MAG: 1-acyl-sn-glycerol-3-phosphate acyltransferase [Bacteroidia bacterium]|nr:1-acyl-sn-glycerol-3-phosphate acyltransferase [Bacteroidia bacterium]
MAKEEDFIHKLGKEGLFEPVLPDIRSWAIYRLGLIRQKLIESVTESSRAALLKGVSEASDLRDLVAEAYYQEKIRMRDIPWKSDPKDDKDFWKSIRNGIQKYSDPNLNPAEAEAGFKKLLDKILVRYSSEIAGDFKIGTFRFAKRVTDIGFARLFNYASEGFLRGGFHPKRRLREKIQLVGDVDIIRTLVTKGTILLLPTHFSNLDSLALGWCIDALGLPAFTYGAGINLFGHPVLSYFMSRLGAFRVDRRKKNKIYLDTLKLYTQEIIERGCHTLFFPGGTRSRNGSIEKHLKLGLLGTALEAQRRLIKQDSDDYRKIFVVPLVINYHFVLEAQNLIDQHLKQEGKEKSVLLNDDFGSVTKNISFLWKFFKSGSELVLSFGKPMDLFGNEVDAGGHSFDHQGRPVDIADYYFSDGKLKQDHQRDSEYTRMLGEEVLKKFYEINVVFSSHLVAFSAFQIFKRQHPNQDLYELLALPVEELRISAAELQADLATKLEYLRSLKEEGKVNLADHLDQDLGEIMQHGLQNLGVYHPTSPLKQDKDGFIVSENLKVLYFYHNRLTGYGLEAIY